MSRVRRSIMKVRIALAALALSAFGGLASADITGKVNLDGKAPEQKEIDMWEGKDVEPFKAAEMFRVKCDVHPWMSAYIGVFVHPYFAVSKEDGTYKIPTKGLADGDYTLTFWHEKYASDPVEEKVTVKDGKAE